MFKIGDVVMWKSGSYLLEGTILKVPPTADGNYTLNIYKTHQSPNKLDLPFMHHATAYTLKILKRKGNNFLALKPINQPEET